MFPLCFQMLEFKMANDVAATAGSRLSTACMAVPERSTSALSSSLGRLFGTPAPSTPGQTREWEDHTADQRHKARGLDSVRQELDEYLEEPLETFSRIVRVNGIEQTAVFDILTYWQVRPFPVFHE